MKSNILKLSAGAIAAALLAPAAMAEPGDGKKPGKRPGKDRPDRPSREEILAKFDANNDGKLDVDERVEMIKARLEKSERFREHFTRRADTDGDGTLSDAEIRAAAEKFGERRGRRPGGEGRRPGGKRGGDKPDAAPES